MVRVAFRVTVTVRVCVPGCPQPCGGAGGRVPGLSSLGPDSESQSESLSESSPSQDRVKSELRPSRIRVESESQFEPQSESKSGSQPRLCSSGARARRRVAGDGSQRCLCRGRRGAVAPAVRHAGTGSSGLSRGRRRLGALRGPRARPAAGGPREDAGRLRPTRAGRGPSHDSGPAAEDTDTPRLDVKAASKLDGCQSRADAQGEGGPRAVSAAGRGWGGL